MEQSMQGSATTKTRKETRVEQVESRKASPRRRCAIGRLGSILGIRVRKCWCMRCTLSRTRIYRRATVQNDRSIHIQTRVLGIQVYNAHVPLDG